MASRQKNKNSSQTKETPSQAVNNSPEDNRSRETNQQRENQVSMDRPIITEGGSSED